MNPTSNLVRDSKYTVVIRLLLSACFLVTPLLFFTDLTTNPFTIQSVLLYVLLALLFGAMAVKFLRSKHLFFTQTFFDLAFFVYVLACVVSWLSGISSAPQALRQTMLFNLLDYGTLLLIVALGAYVLSKNIPFAGHIERKTNWILLFIIWGSLWFLLPFVKTTLQADNVFAQMFDWYSVILWAGGLFLAMRILRQLTQENILLLAFVSCFLACSYGVMQSLGIEFLWPFELNVFASKAFSTFGNPNFLSSVVVMLLPALIVYYLRAQTRKDMWVYCLLALMFVLYLSFSLCRSCWLAAGVAFVMMWMFGTLRALIWSRKGRMLLLVLLAVGVSYGSVAVGGKQTAVVERAAEVMLVTPKTVSLSVGKDQIFQSLHQRLFMWDVSKEIFLARPVLGVGLGNFQMAFAQYQPKTLLRYPNLRELKTRTNSPHNEILFQLSQGGIVAAGLFLFMFMVLFLEVRDFATHKKEGDKKQLLQALFCGILAMLADNMLNVSLHAVVPAFIFWWLVGAEASGVGRDDRTIRISVNPATKTIALCLFALCVCVIVWQGLVLSSEYRSFKGERSMVLEQKQEAAQQLIKAQQLYRANTSAGYKAGNLYLSAQQYRQSLATFEKALSAAAYYDEVYFHAALAALGVKDNKKAINLLIHSLKLHPYNLQAYDLLSELIYQDVIYATDESLLLLERGVKLFAYSTNLWHRLGDIYQKREEPEYAKNIYKRALLIDTLDKGLLKSLAALSARSDEHPPVLLQARKLQAFYNQVLRYNQLSESARRKLRSQIEDYCKEYPDDTNGPILLARFLSLSGNDIKSKELLEGVLKRFADDLPANLALSALLYKAEDIDGARKYLQNALFYYPENQVAAARLKALGKQGT